MRVSYRHNGMIIVVSDSPRGAPSRSEGVYATLVNSLSKSYQNRHHTIDVYMWVESGVADSVFKLESAMRAALVQEVGRANWGLVRGEESKAVYYECNSAVNVAYAAIKVPITRDCADHEVLDRAERILLKVGIQEAQGFADRAHQAMQSQRHRTAGKDDFPTR